MIGPVYSSAAASASPGNASTAEAATTKALMLIAHPPALFVGRSLDAVDLALDVSGGDTDPAMRKPPRKHVLAGDF